MSDGSTSHRACACLLQSIYETMELTMYNITFTSLPILLYGIFEKHVPTHELMNNPKIYM